MTGPGIFSRLLGTSAQLEDLDALADIVESPRPTTVRRSVLECVPDRPPMYHNDRGAQPSLSSVLRIIS